MGEVPHLFFRHGREIPGELRILPDHLVSRHAHHGGCHRQAPGVLQQLLDAALVRTASDQGLLPHYLHRQNAQVLLTCHGQSHLLEACLDPRVRHHAMLPTLHALLRGIESHLDAIEVVAFQGGLEHYRVVMTGNADEARQLLVAHPVKRIQHAMAGLDFRQIVLAHQSMHVDQIDLTGLKPL